MRENFIAVFITCSSRKEAVCIADAILRKKLAACANIISELESKFWWNGKIVKAKEALVIAKTSRRRFISLEREVKRLHSYEVPEIIALPIVAGSKSYLEWIDKNTK